MTEKEYYSKTYQVGYMAGWSAAVRDGEPEALADELGANVPEEQRSDWRRGFLNGIGAGRDCLYNAP